MKRYLRRCVERTVGSFLGNMYGVYSKSHRYEVGDGS